MDPVKFGSGFVSHAEVLTVADKLGWWTDSFDSIHVAEETESIPKSLSQTSKSLVKAFREACLNIKSTLLDPCAADLLIFFT